MTTLSKDEVVRLAREAGFSQDWQFAVPPAILSNFATLCRADLVAELADYHNEAGQVLDNHLKLIEQLRAAVERLKKQVIRAANFELDLLRALDGQATLCGFAEIAEVEKLKADNLDLRSDEALNDAEALIRQAGAALLPHKSTVLRWYTPVDAALDAIEEYFK